MGNARFSATCRLMLCMPALLLVLSACTSSRVPGDSAAGTSSSDRLLPRPATVHTMGGAPFTLTAQTRIAAGPGTEAVGRYLADFLRPATGYSLAIAQAAGENTISLRADANNPALGDEGYELTVSPTGIVIRANQAAGVFYGIQTLRQLLPPAIEQKTTQSGPWPVDAVHIVDQPRFAWRGAMLDVARHFFGVPDVKRLIDEMTLYKLNRLHLHLSDDQGWRIQINGWPELTTRGSSTKVGGGEGGFYTQDQYAEIVRYAGERFITIVPEIDMPGHTNAALASYAQLNCDNKLRDLYTGIEVGFSSFCVEKEEVYQFIDDVVRDLARLTPTPYIHIGGDEVKTLTPDQYNGFINRVQGIVVKHGKQTVGWDEIAHADLLPSTIVQLWAGEESGVLAVKKGAKLIMSPSNRIYLDMKYDSTTALGLDWAGFNPVQDAYDWDPAQLLTGVGASNILGVEAPLWTETILTMADIEQMFFPRLAGVAEIGWSPAGRNWEEYRRRLGAQGPRWTAMGMNFYRAPEVPWQ